MNRLVHFEIHATNPETLSKFYADTFGWMINHMPQMDYWLLDTGGGMGGNGGMLRRRGPAAPEGAPVNAFVCSVGVDSVDASLQRALDNGATVALPKMAIPGVGYQVYIKDPDGNILGLHQPDSSAR
jgi:predicted enzyme related to lactoylglutathione lyase